jgi:DNA-directed RNA polymerase subunit RPC12/RpoP
MNDCSLPVDVQFPTVPWFVEPQVQRVGAPFDLVQLVVCNKPKPARKDPRTMKSLDQHNREVLARQNEPTVPHPNGIECPECGSELWDSSPTMLLISNPPQKHVHCEKCGFRGHRLA